MALARKIVSRDEESVEDAFAQARDAESAAEELLVDEGWKVLEVEPEAVAVNGNGTTGNGHHADGIGPTVELAPAPVHTNGNGNGHHSLPRTGYGDEADEPQQTLFSWAEFMCEPVKPKRRNGKPQPASLSMFEWALSREEKREKETVGAGR